MMHRISFVLFLLTSGATFLRGDELPTDVECPRECTCGYAPLRSAPFVLTWMTSWGEDDLPDIHPNDVLDAEAMVKSDTASDAGVDVDIVGLHSTCSLHQTVNLTRLLASLPSSTMVLSILQAPGCNLTIIDGGELARLSSLKALHLQGYAHVSSRQVSGFQPNSIVDMIMHQKLMQEETKKEADYTRDLRLGLVEDALFPLKKIELLDLQYVRLVASEEAKRLRRYSKEPISATTLLDLPLKKFLKVANQVDSFTIPLHLKHLYTRENISNKLTDKLVENSKDDFQYLEHIERENKDNEHGNNKLPLFDSLSELNKKVGFVQKNKSSFIIPYSIYKVEMQPKLAPFKNLRMLKYLRMAHARLDNIGAELLEGLQNLHTLTLEHNKIKMIPSGLFTSTPNLRHLSLAHNSVLMINADTFESLTNLLTLDLDFNQLSILGPATFPSLPSLKTLRIDENPLTQLLPDTFAALNATESICLGSSSVSMDLHENSFRFLYNVNDLVLKNVSHLSLKKTLLAGMPNVQHFSIHGKVPEIDYDAFSMTPNLEILNVSNCYLSFLSLDALYGLNKLQILDLSHNEIVSLSPGTFDHLSSLRELYLNDNLLSTLPLGIFLPIPAKLIQLQNNPWHCTCDLLQLRPSITNKVKRPGHVVCQWDDKTEAVCEKAKDRLVYDARVAPLCQTPLEFTGSDAYHSALRHLNCSKYHWNPRLLISENKIINSNVANQISELPLTRDITDEENFKESGWLPLTAYTPPPIDTDDLLEIAEREGLEEAIEETSQTTTDSSKLHKDSTNKHEEIIKEMEQRRIQQSDDPLLKLKFSKTYLNKDIASYKVQKAKIKAILKQNALRKKQEKMRKLKYLIQNEKKYLKKTLYSKQQKKNHNKKKENILSKQINSRLLKTNFLI